MFLAPLRNFFEVCSKLQEWLEESLFRAFSNAALLTLYIPLRETRSNHIEKIDNGHDLMPAKNASILPVSACIAMTCASLCRRRVA